MAQRFDTTTEEIDLLTVREELLRLAGRIGMVTSGGYVSCESLDPRELLAAAELSRPGDEIRLPEGDVPWIDKISVTLKPDVTLRGAGAARTVIVDDSRDDSSLLVVNTAPEGRTTIRDLTIKGGSGELKNNRLVQIGGQSKACRVTNCSFDTSTYTDAANRRGGAVRFVGWINGVVDNCDIHAYQGVDVWMSTHSGQQYGDGSWAAPTNFGSSDAVFVERCKFKSRGGSITDGYAGGRLVVRYNECNHITVHPTGGAGRNRGVRAIEVYGNTFRHTETSPKSNAIWISSGTAVIWGNTCVDKYASLLALQAMRDDNTTYPQKPHPQGWGYAGTEFNGTGSPWDGNFDDDGQPSATPTLTGWPPLDGPGMGQGNLLAGAFPNVIDTTTGRPGWPQQRFEPVYLKDNVWTKVTNYANSKLVTGDGAKENITFILDALPDGYTPYLHPHPLTTL